MLIAAFSGRPAKCDCPIFHPGVPFTVPASAGLPRHKRLLSSGFCYGLPPEDGLANNQENRPGFEHRRLAPVSTPRRIAWFSRSGLVAEQRTARSALPRLLRRRFVRLLQAANRCVQPTFHRTDGDAERIGSFAVF